MTPSAKTRQFSLFAIVGLLLILGLGQSIHRHLVYDVPWVPGTEKSVWSIEASVQFFARGEPVTVNLRRPSDQEGFAVVDENGASPGYGLSFVNLAAQPTAQWTVREANG